MTGAPIDASLRGTETPEQVQGAEVPDSKTNLAASPQLIMSPGVSRPVFKFADGAGLTDAFGNVYDGYGGSGGSSFIHQNTPAASVGEAADGANDGEFLVFDDVFTQYLPKTYVQASLMELTNTVTPLDGQLAIYDSINVRWIPQKSDEPFAGIIEAPTNRVYTLTKDGLAYDVEVVSSSFLFEVGPGSVAFPADTSVISAGTPITITVSATTGASTFLNYQLDVKRRLSP